MYHTVENSNKNAKLSDFVFLSGLLTLMVIVGCLLFGMYFNRPELLIKNIEYRIDFLSKEDNKDHYLKLRPFVIDDIKVLKEIINNRQLDLSVSEITAMNKLKSLEYKFKEQDKHYNIGVDQK